MGYETAAPGRASVLPVAVCAVTVVLCASLFTGCILDDGKSEAPVQGYTVSGQISDRNGQGLDLVSVSLVGMPEGRYSGDPFSLLTTTDGMGAFSFGGVPSGNYTVTPYRNGFSFYPRNRAVVVGRGDVSLDLITGFVSDDGGGPDGDGDGGEEGAGFSITGIVTDAGGSALPGIHVGLSGESVGRSTQTDENGRFRFDNVPRGSYIVAPGDEKYTFFPPKAGVYVRGYNVILDAFTAVLNEPDVPGGGDRQGVTHDYYPLKQGASWSFAVTETDYLTYTADERPVTRLISGLKRIGGRDYWRITDDSGETVSLVRIENDTVYTFSELADLSRIGSSDGSDGDDQDGAPEGWNPNEDDMPLIRLDAAAGETYPVASYERGISGAFVFVDWQGTFAGYEDVTVIAGAFEHCRRYTVVKTSYAVGGGSSSSETTATDIWLAPGVGVVRTVAKTSGATGVTWTREEELVGYSIP